MRYVKTVKCTKNRTTDKQTPQMADSTSIGATSDFASSWSSSYLNDLMNVLYNFPESFGKIKPFGCVWKYREKRTIPWSIIISSIETAVFFNKDDTDMLFGQTHDVILLAFLGCIFPCDISPFFIAMSLVSPSWDPEKKNSPREVPAKACRSLR